jgi:hypothetical protein
MKSKILFFASGLFFLGTLASIAGAWHGTAGINLGFPVNTTTNVIQLSGATKGWPVLLALILLMTALVFFVTAVIRWILTE